MNARKKNPKTPKKEHTHVFTFKWKDDTNYVYKCSCGTLLVYPREASSR